MMQLDPDEPTFPRVRMVASRLTRKAQAEMLKLDVLAKAKALAATPYEAKPLKEYSALASVTEGVDLSSEHDEVVVAVKEFLNVIIDGVPDMVSELAVQTLAEHFESLAVAGGTPRYARTVKLAAQEHYLYIYGKQWAARGTNHVEILTKDAGKELLNKLSRAFMVVDEILSAKDTPEGEIDDDYHVTKLYVSAQKLLKDIRTAQSSDFAKTLQAQAAMIVIKSGISIDCKKAWYDGAMTLAKTQEKLDATINKKENSDLKDTLDVFAKVTVGFCE